MQKALKSGFLDSNEPFNKDYSPRPTGRGHIFAIVAQRYSSRTVGNLAADSIFDFLHHDLVVTQEIFCVFAPMPDPNVNISQLSALFAVR